MKKTDGIPEGAIAKGGSGVEYIYENGKWKPTKTTGWEAPLHDVQLLNSKVAKGDYKVWNQKLQKYVQGDAIPLSPKAGANALLKDVLAVAKENELKKRSFSVGVKDAIEEKKAVATGNATKAEKNATKAEKEAVIRDTSAVTETLKTKGLADYLPATAKALKDAAADKAFYTQDEMEANVYGDTPLGQALAGSQPEAKANPFDNLGSLAAYLPDAFKFGLGLLGANEQLPQYEIPQEFLDYKAKMQSLSEQGLTADELAKAKTDAERGYAYDVNAIKDFAGGKAGVALGNLGRATTSLQDAYKNINVADAAMRRSNLANYGSVIGQYLNLDRMQFGDRYQEALLNKQAGAQLAADALSNIQGRADYEKTYGKGSIYDQFMQSQLKGVDLQNELLQYQIDNPPQIENMTNNPTTFDMGNYPQFLQYLMGVK